MGLMCVCMCIMHCFCQADSSVAYVVGPAVLLGSSICFTVANSLATASTSIGIAAALASNLVAWSRWINNAEIFILSLR